MIYIIDFDDILFDVKKFKLACEKTGINFNNKIYNKSKINNIYNPEKHLKLLNKEYSDLEKVIKKSKSFLFSEVLEKLEKLSQNNKLILLSKGNKKFQESKIKNSGIAKFFDEIFITDSKLKIFQEKIIPKYENEKIVFIDDKESELRQIKNNYPEIEVFKSLPTR